MLRMNAFVLKVLQEWKASANDLHLFHETASCCGFLIFRLIPVPARKTTNLHGQ